MAYLTIKTHSPSSSTCSYTVTNAPSRRSPLSKLVHMITLVLRFALAAVLLFTALLQSWPSWNGGQTQVIYEKSLCSAVDSTIGHRYNCYGDRWWILAVAALGVAWGLSRRGYTEESLLVIRGMGIQTSTSSASYLSTPTTRFIPTTQLQDIFIHEAFIGFSVTFYLAVIVDGEDEAVVVFPKLLPRREVLEEVWRGARGVLGWSKS